MLRNRVLLIIGSFIIVAATLFVGRFASSMQSDAVVRARVFEIRTYTTEKGKLPDLLKRFRDHTTRLFEKHGMTNVGYWTPTDEPRSQNTLIYILAHDSRAAADRNWKNFRADPEWQKVQKASEAAGKIVTKVESVFAEATDFSPTR